MRCRGQFASGLLFMGLCSLGILILALEGCGKHHRLGQAGTVLVVGFLPLRVVLCFAFRQRCGQEGRLNRRLLLLLLVGTHLQGSERPGHLPTFGSPKQFHLRAIVACPP